MHRMSNLIWRYLPIYRCIIITFVAIPRSDTSARSSMSRWENKRMKETFDVL